MAQVFRVASGSMSRDMKKAMVGVLFYRGSFLPWMQPEQGDAANRSNCRNAGNASIDNTPVRFPELLFVHPASRRIVPCSIFLCQPEFCADIRGREFDGGKGKVRQIGELWGTEESAAKRQVRGNIGIVDIDSSFAIW